MRYPASEKVAGLSSLPRRRIRPSRRERGRNWCKPATRDDKMT
jgi:hypothetical protein